MGFPTLAAEGSLFFSADADAPWSAQTRWLQIRDSEGNQVLLESLKEG